MKILKLDLPSRYVACYGGAGGLNRFPWKRVWLTEPMDAEQACQCFGTVYWIKQPAQEMLILLREAARQAKKVGEHAWLGDSINVYVPYFGGKSVWCTSFRKARSAYTPKSVGTPVLLREGVEFPLCHTCVRSFDFLTGDCIPGDLSCIKEQEANDEKEPN